MSSATDNEPQSGAKQDMSIEQSVHLCRIFTVLRSGDTNAISKLIKESHDPQSEPLATTVLHLAIQCTEPQTVEYVMSCNEMDINTPDRDGNTPLHIAASLGRLSIVKELLKQPSINDSVTNSLGQIPLDLAQNPEIFQILQLSRLLFLDTKKDEIQALIATGDHDKLKQLLLEPRVEGLLDINYPDLVADKVTAESGGTLLHEAARKKDTKLIQFLLTHGADPFCRDRLGKLPQDVVKDDKTRSMLKKSNAAVVAQRGIQEKAILKNASGGVHGVAPGGKESREMKGYLKKWTNYTSGWKLRWFVLEDGVLSYYKHQDDTGSACRGAINMKVAKLNMDLQDKTRFAIHGKSSVKYHLKADHSVEAARWFWALNNAVQWAKDEAKEEERRRALSEQSFRQAKIEHADKQELPPPEPSSEVSSARRASSRTAPTHGPPAGTSSSSGQVNTSTPSISLSKKGAESVFDGDISDDPFGPPEGRGSSYYNPTIAEGYEDDDDSSQHLSPVTKDAFSITRESLKLHLYLLNNVATHFRVHQAQSPQTALSDPSVERAFATLENTVSEMDPLVYELMKISRDREAYWQHKLQRETERRVLWEKSMARVVREHEELQKEMLESEEKRKRTKKALKGALFSKHVEERTSASDEVTLSNDFNGMNLGPQDKVLAAEAQQKVPAEGGGDRKGADLTSAASSRPGSAQSTRRDKNTSESYKELAVLSDSESDDEMEFYDAVDYEDMEAMQEPPLEDAKAPAENSSALVLRKEKQGAIEPSFKGYEDEPRKRLKLDADNRPTLSLWSILKSMIGKDMTKMTLPVSFNEPTSLLQRVAEDLEYTDLLDKAVDRSDSIERLVYVGAFAASEYASTIGRVAKPFNPLLGETFEYVRPDKGFRFYIEQVSHHPPIGAAYAESSKWDYWGESAVKSKFYGKSFDINPLGTWFLRLRPVTGGEELYTWKKVTSSVVGIITGNPTVDNYGPMEIKNWNTGEVCYIDFKPRGWKVSSAYQVSGKVMDAEGSTKWSIGGRWNDKIFAKKSPGQQEVIDSSDVKHPEFNGLMSPTEAGSKAFVVWQVHPRPEGIPFNLTPFVLTLNALPDKLRPFLPPTDTRLRPDQRAMEDGEYDFAAEEKHRVEEKQRTKRRQMEASGKEFAPKWFSRGVCQTTGEEYWVPNGDYWRCRDQQDWSRCDDIF